ncbi:MAG: ATP-binding protein, partial [Poseidonibacter sp.]|uniref:ATP-binding protein n=1 Tax=Poseidonibacter sp. TaxID=2321188 RepID=UPI00359CCDCC
LLTREQRLFLKNRDTFRMCVQSNSYPYQEMQNNEFLGIVSKYTKLFEKSLDKKITIVPTTNENIAKQYLIDDKCDLISYLTKKDTNDFIYTKNYLSLPIVLLTKNSKEFVYNFEQLNDKRLLISNSKIDVNYLKQKYPDIQFKINTNEENVLDQIYDENVYGFVTDIIHAIDILKKQTGVNIHIGGKFDENITLGFVLNENNKILADILDKFIENISKSQHDKLMSSFTYINYKEVPDYSLLWKVLTLSFIFSLILIIFIFREEKLKQKIITLNKDLKIRIKDEVALNRKKDEFIFRQSKLASMGEMLTNIAHQWRQPLTRINLSIEVMSSVIENEETKNKSILEEKISLIKKDIVYMSNTIHDFSNFFHPNKEMSIFNLNDVIGKSISLVKNKDIDIEFIIEIDKEITLKNYENELIQVIMVLLDNSIDSFKLKKYGNKKINIYTKKFEKNIELSILDNAGGIDARIISRIFEPYFSTKFKDQGVGIGLYMAKMLIEDSMRGNIIVDSFDDFTHFTISLPRIINE